MKKIIVLLLLLSAIAFTSACVALPNNSQNCEHDFDLNEFAFSSKDGHAHKCKKCDEHDELNNHISNAPATVDSAEICSLCGWEIAPKLSDDSSSDDNSGNGGSNDDNNNNDDGIVVGSSLFGEGNMQVNADDTGLFGIGTQSLNIDISAEDFTLTYLVKSTNPAFEMGGGFRVDANGVEYTANTGFILESNQYAVRWLNNWSGVYGVNNLLNNDSFVSGVYTMIVKNGNTFKHFYRVAENSSWVMSGSISLENITGYYFTNFGNDGVSTYTYDDITFTPTAPNLANTVIANGNVSIIAGISSYEHVGQISFAKGEEVITTTVDNNGNYSATLTSGGEWEVTISNSQIRPKTYLFDNTGTFDLEFAYPLLANIGNSSLTPDNFGYVGTGSWDALNIPVTQNQFTLYYTVQSATPETRGLGFAVKSNDTNSSGNMIEYTAEAGYVVEDGEFRLRWLNNWNGTSGANLYIDRDDFITGVNIMITRNGDTFTMFYKNPSTNEWVQAAIFDEDNVNGFFFLNFSSGSYSAKDFGYLPYVNYSNNQVLVKGIMKVSSGSKTYVSERTLITFTKGNLTYKVTTNNYGEYSIVLPEGGEWNISPYGCFALSQNFNGDTTADLIFGRDIVYKNAGNTGDMSVGTDGNSLSGGHWRAVNISVTQNQFTLYYTVQSATPETRGLGFTVKSNDTNSSGNMIEYTAEAGYVVEDGEFRLRWLNNWNGTSGKNLYIDRDDFISGVKIMIVRDGNTFMMCYNNQSTNEWTRAAIFDEDNVNGFFFLNFSENSYSIKNIEYIPYLTNENIVVPEVLPETKEIIAYSQEDARWANLSHGNNPTGNNSIIANGCGILSVVNALNYKRGVADVYNLIDDLATWAYQVGAYNSGFDGIWAGQFYSVFASSTFASTYNVSFGSEIWSSANDSRLKNHLSQGGVAIAHVAYGHMICLASYDYATDTYLVLDSYPRAAHGTANGVAYLTTSQLSGAIAKMTVDRFALMTFN